MNILDEIVEVKKEEVRKLKSEYSYSRFTDSEFFEKKTKSAIEQFGKNNDISIISEIKKASPSKGVLKEDFHHLNIAEAYLSANTDAISVLTDKNFFKGSNEYLSDVARIADVPLLRKDFIIDELQVFEAKAIGADFILLIAEILSATQIEELTAAAKEHTMDVLLELHSSSQLRKINFQQNRLIGINNRNLDTFKVDLQTTKELADHIPDTTTIVSESGIHTKKDICFIKQTPAKAILVGEHFMKSNDIKSALEEMKEWCHHES